MAVRKYLEDGKAGEMMVGVEEFKRALSVQSFASTNDRRITHVALAGGGT